MPRLSTIYRWTLLVETLRSERYLCWTQERLAREINVSVFTVSNWETGRAVPSPRHRAMLRELAIGAQYAEADWPLLEFEGPRAISAKDHPNDRRD
jgi:transcriptional regulator with XRE-family HTH domain